MHGPSSDAARFARSLNSVANQTEVWRQLKALAAPFGFDHLTVLKRTDDLPHRIANALGAEVTVTFTDTDTDTEELLGTR